MKKKLTLTVIKSILKNKLRKKLFKILEKQQKNLSSLVDLIKLAQNKLVV